MKHSRTKPLIVPSSLSDDAFLFCSIELTSISKKEDIPEDASVYLGGLIINNEQNQSFFADFSRTHRFDREEDGKVFIELEGTNLDPEMTISSGDFVPLEWSQLQHNHVFDELFVEISTNDNVELPFVFRRISIMLEDPNRNGEHVSLYNVPQEQLDTFNAELTKEFTNLKED